jgi:hypothetical protein
VAVSFSRLCRAVALLAGALALSAPAEAQDVRVSDGNALALTTTSFGYFGNNFINRSPSMEYPLGSGYEHLTHGGLWIGAQAIDGSGAFTGVVTGALDFNIGLLGTEYSEWTKLTTLQVRSSLPISPFYSPAAISELDVLSEYDDHVVKTVIGNPEPHRPMGIHVRQHVYQWSFGGYESIVFMRLFIHNAGTSPLTGVHAGLYTEFASGNKNAYSCWPPSSGCGPSPWFSRKWLAYDAASRVMREHYCAAQPVPGGCNLGLVPPWVALELLTSLAADQNVTVAAWPYGPGNPARDQDVERYALMSAGTIADFTTPALAPQTGDPMEVLAIGPFASVAPGDSIEVCFAFLGAPDEASLPVVAASAQQLHDVRFVVPPPADVGVPSAASFGIEALRPNPTSGGDPVVSFALDRAGPARLEVLDLSGRRVRSIETATSAGRHLVRLDGTQRLSPGVYVVRLIAGERTSTARLSIVR